MDHINTIGLIAGMLTTMSFIPQAVKVYRTRHTQDLSLPMYIVLLTGVSLWMWYGVMVRSHPIIIANGATLVIGAYILIMKLKYK